MFFHALIKLSPAAAAPGAGWLLVTTTCTFSDFKVVVHGHQAAGTFGFQGSYHCWGLCPLPSPLVFPSPLQYPQEEGKKGNSHLFGSYCVLTVCIMLGIFTNIFHQTLRHNCTRVLSLSSLLPIKKVRLREVRNLPGTTKAPTNTKLYPHQVGMRIPDSKLQSPEDLPEKKPQAWLTQEHGSEFR